MSDSIKSFNSLVKTREDDLAHAEIEGQDETRVTKLKTELSRTKSTRSKQFRKSIRMPLDLWDRVAEAARVLSTTPSDIIRIAVDDLFLDSGASLLEHKRIDLLRIPTIRRKM